MVNLHEQEDATMATKTDFVNNDRALYQPNHEPVVVDVPGFELLAVDGHGDPSTAPEYAAAVSACTHRLHSQVRHQEGPGHDDGVLPWRACGGPSWSLRPPA